MRIANQAIVYGTSVALNRGGVLLSTPLLVAWFGLVDFGIYSLTLVASQLLANLLSLNGSIAVMREGAEDVQKGSYLFRRFSILTILLGSVVTAFVWPFDNSSFHWLGYAFLLGATEGLQQLLLNWLRCRNRQFSYLFFSVVRTIGILLSIFLVSKYHGNLETLFFAQLMWCAALFAGFTLIDGLVSKTIDSKSVAIRGVLAYALPMIPHAAAQWVINGSDRLIIKAMVGEEALGIYSLAYSFAMVVMLVNSGLALTLPQQIIQNYDQWSLGSIRGKTLKAYTAVVVVLVLGVLIALEIDHRTIQWLPTGTGDVPLIVGLVSAGLYLQGIYYLYGNFYFYHRKTSKLAVQTVIAAIANILLTIVFVQWLGIVGAAIATFLTYVGYLTMLISGLKNIEPRLKRMLKADLKLVPFSVAGLFLLGLFHGLLWQ